MLGGLAARLDLTLESLEDLQLALDELLERARRTARSPSRIRIDDDAIEALVGPFDARCAHELERDDGRRLGLSRVLETVVDRVELDEGDGGRGSSSRRRRRAKPS